MKKILLGTTALAAASIVAGGVAQAAEEPISLGLGGYYRAAMGVVDGDDGAGQPESARTSVAFGQDVELTVSGSTTLDNGLTVGVSAQIEGNAADETGSASLDERFLFFRGSFGMVRLGSSESARQEMTNFAPNGAWNFGVNSPFFIFANPGNGLGIFNVRTYDDGIGQEDALKLSYYTPTFNGFRVGVSYAPDDTGFGQYGGNTAQDAGEFRDHAAIGAEFSNDFGDINLRLMAGYERYTLEACAAAVSSNNCVDDPSSIQFGATVSFGPWSVGGGYLQSDQIARAGGAAGGTAPTVFNALERTDFDVGVSYWSGPWGVGLLWGHAEIENGLTTTSTGEHELDIFALNATYIIGPGIDLEAQVDFGEIATAGSATTASKTANDNDWTQFMVGTAITF